MEIIYSKIPRGVRSDVYLDIMTLTNVKIIKSQKNLGNIRQIFLL